ncbi:MAG TPA: hypothetical protein VER33_23680 [Polyangiaceae bacterium]|nr:hypothetical protein [Polyangiaceae bacterium]
MNVALLTLPLGLQATFMLVDELHFHRKRGLPRWERVGHPLDTLSVLACYALTLGLAPTPESLWVYAAASAFSCIFITKDELVHAKACDAWEQWLHAVLFVLHPIVLACTALLWLSGARTLLVAQAALTCAFGLYQVIYWNAPWQRPQHGK